MSRSRRKHPFCGITTARSEHWWKAICNRALRVAVRCQLARMEDPDELLMPARRGDSAHGWGPKDGKQIFNAARFPELMRK